MSPGEPTPFNPESSGRSKQKESSKQGSGPQESVDHHRGLKATLKAEVLAEAQSSMRPERLYLQHMIEAADSIVAGRSGAEAFDPTHAVESGIEGEDLSDLVPFHDGDVDGIACRQVAPFEDDGLGALDRRRIHRDNLVDEAEQDVERRLDGIAAIDGHIVMQDLLKDLGVSDQALALDHAALQQSLHFDLAGMSSADQVHRDIGVHEDQRVSPPR